MMETQDSALKLTLKLEDQNSANDHAKSDLDDFNLINFDDAHETPDERNDTKEGNRREFSSGLKKGDQEEIGEDIILRCINFFENIFWYRNCM